jgi:hypothetical protein
MHHIVFMIIFGMEICLKPCFYGPKTRPKYQARILNPSNRIFLHIWVLADHRHEAKKQGYKIAKLLFNPYTYNKIRCT